MRRKGLVLDKRHIQHETEPLCKSAPRVIGRLLDPGAVDRGSFQRPEHEDLYKIERIIQEAKENLSPHWAI